MPKVALKRKDGVRLSGGSRVDVILSAATGSRVFREKELQQREKELEKRKEALDKAEASLARRRIVEASLEAGYHLDPLNFEEIEEYADSALQGDDDDPMDGSHEGLDDDAAEGEEGEDAGGDEDSAAAFIASLYAGSRAGHPPRSRRINAANLHAKWDEQAPALVDVYLGWKEGGSSYSPASTSGTDEGPRRELTVFCISLSDAFPLSIAGSEHPNILLVRQGYLAGTTDRPKVAFSLECLEFYRQLRTRHAPLGIQAWVKTLCAILQLTYRDSVRNVFSLAFDGYLAIHRLLHARIDRALGRDSPDWHAKYDCPACGHKVPGEPRIVPDRLHAMDGNESARRLLGCGGTDGREFRGGHWIYPDEVDRFADEVPSRAAAKAKGKGKANAPARADVEDDEGICPSVETWKAERAQAETRSVTQVFDQTGIFLTTCRHGIVEKVEEMVRSGELAKYGLAAIAKIMENYGEDQAVGSDIGCSFGGTVKRSSLGKEAEEKNLTILVNAFHGYAHKRACQLVHHPLYLPGLGLEDLETCERIFSSLNSVAGGVRHASHFHWRQAISFHLEGMVSDRYGSLSRFIYNNYRQALIIINQAEAELPKHAFTAEDYERWREEEIAYYRASQKEPEEDTLRAAYVQALINLESASDLFNRLLSAAPIIVSSGRAEDASAAATQAALEQERKAAYRKVNLAEKRATDLERRMGISRWTKTDPAYASALHFLNRAKFTLAVDQLSAAVVSRLQELSKTHLRGTGYKLRKQIAKNIARRGGAIKSLIAKVNKLGAALDPPLPKLSYAEVVNISYLAEFDLLKESRRDVRQQPWTLQRNRELQTLYFKSLRAREEIERLHREVLRLQHWVDAEDRQYGEAIATLQAAEPHLAAYIARVAQSRRLQNAQHRLVLGKLYALPGYAGPRPFRPHFRRSAFLTPAASHSIASSPGAHAPTAARLAATSTACGDEAHPGGDSNGSGNGGSGSGDDDEDDDDDDDEAADEDADQALALFGNVLQSF